VRSEEQEAGAARLSGGSRLGGEASTHHPLLLTPHGETSPLTPHPSLLTAKLRVAVLGAGWAGLAAAVELADAGAGVTVYEASRTLGGRARRVDYNGVALDNGLHILIGAYRETLRLIDKVKHGRGGGLLRKPLELQVLGKFRLRASALPAPFHLAAGLLWSQGLTLAQRLRAAYLMTQLRAAHFTLDEDTSVDALLSRFKQSPAVRRYLWEPLCVSALNTPPAEASAQVFLNVLRDSFNGSREDSELLLPAENLGALFPEPAARFIAAAGGKIVDGCSVQSVTREGDKLRVISQQGLERFSHVICALPPFRLPEVLGGMRELAAVLETVSRLRHEPIYSVYLQYPQNVRLPQAMLGLEGGRAQWLFDRGRLCAQPGLIGVVISGGRSSRRAGACPAGPAPAAVEPGDRREARDLRLRGRCRAPGAAHSGPQPLPRGRLYCEPVPRHARDCGAQRGRVRADDSRIATSCKAHSEPTNALTTKDTKEHEEHGLASSGAGPPQLPPGQPRRIIPRADENPRFPSCSFVSFVVNEVDFV
jgi:hydroxysqualene dehydroxylase